MGDALALPSFIVGIVTVFAAIVAAYAAIVAVRRSDTSIDLSRQQIALAEAAVPAADLRIQYVETDRHFSQGWGTGALNPRQYMLTSVTISNAGTTFARDLKVYASTVESDQPFDSRALLSHQDAGGWVVMVPIVPVHFVQVTGEQQLQRVGDSMAPVDTVLRVTYSLPGSNEVLEQSETLHFHENA